MDSVYQTFLVLCRMMNYRLTAEELHLTQPAVTKQIQKLEQLYNAKLFVYDGRRLHKTRQCEILEEYCRSLRYNYNEIKKALNETEEKIMRVGATKTIGDYALFPYITTHLADKTNGLSLVVDNTEKLMSLLDSAEIDFAVIEGFFDKEKYGFKLFRREPFVGICRSDHKFSHRKVTVEEILEETLIVRESGSGTRDILEHELKSVGYDITSFSKTIYISSFKLIKELILQNTGISFVYKAVIGNDKKFAYFEVENFAREHEFNIVYLKNAFARRYAERFFGFEGVKPE